MSDPKGWAFWTHVEEEGATRTMAGDVAMGSVEANEQLISLEIKLVWAGIVRDNYFKIGRAHV